MEIEPRNWKFFDLAVSFHPLWFVRACTEASMLAMLCPQVETRVYALFNGAAFPPVPCPGMMSNFGQDLPPNQVRTLLQEKRIESISDILFTMSSP